jgi:hypothetical protein
MNSEKSSLPEIDTGTAATAEERRRSPRATYVAPAWLSAEAGTRGPNYQVVVFNLSLHGVGFTSEKPLESKAIHWIVIGAGGLRASSRLRIVNCRQRDDGQYDCGAQFF